MILFVLALALTPIAESQLVTEENGREVFPVAFRGTWASSLAECSKNYSSDRVYITENRIYGYESESVLVKAGRVYSQSNPHRFPSNGVYPHSMQALVAGSFETNVAMRKLRISRLEEHLYLSDAEEVSAEDHFKSDYRNVRCPEKAVR